MSCSKIGRSSPVGVFATGAGPDGIQDMAGNVWEWCADWFDDGYYSKSTAKNPKGPDKGAGRVVRGASWCDVSWYARSACRSDVVPDDRINSIGCRVVWSVGARTR